MPFEPTMPDYSGDGIAIWKAIDKNGKPYLKVKVLQGKTINCFKVEFLFPNLSSAVKFMREVPFLVKGGQTLCS